MKKLLRKGLLTLISCVSAMGHGPAFADSTKDINAFISLIKQTGTKVQKTDNCPANTYGFYQPPQKDGSGDRLVFCSNRIDFEDTSAVWEVLAHEGAHVMQACNGGLLWKEEYHPRMLRKLKEQAPHYAKILTQYRGKDKMYELEAFDMELSTAQQVIGYFKEFCIKESGRPTSETQQQEAAQQGANNAADSIFALVGGESSFKALMQWAAQNLSAQEQQQLMAVIKSGNLQQIKYALLALQTRFNQSQNYQNYRLF